MDRIRAQAITALLLIATTASGQSIILHEANRRVTVDTITCTVSLIWNCDTVPYHVFHMDEYKVYAEYIVFTKQHTRIVAYVGKSPWYNAKVIVENWKSGGP